MSLELLRTMLDTAKQNGVVRITADELSLIIRDFEQLKSHADYIESQLIALARRISDSCTIT